jgi:hypothetical protein
MRQAAISALALAMGLGVTSAYHLGYQDFRGPKLLQANVGNAIAALPTLLSRNPLASPMAHATLHVTAVVHNPQSHLFLPPHALRSVRPAATEGVAANVHFRVENAHFQIMDGPDVLQARSVREQRASFGMILNKLRMRDSRRCPSAQAVGW